MTLVYLYKRHNQTRQKTDCKRFIDGDALRTTWRKVELGRTDIKQPMSCIKDMNSKVNNNPVFNFSFVILITVTTFNNSKLQNIFYKRNSQNFSNKKGNKKGNKTKEPVDST